MTQARTRTTDSATQWRTFGDDIPKEELDDDKLDVAPLARKVAGFIRNLDHPHNGYVLGLHGPWGSGKSTFLNFVIKCLGTTTDGSTSDEDKIRIVEFKPWIVAGHQDLLAAFIKVLSESAFPQTKAKKFFRFMARSADGKTGEVIDAIAKVAVALDSTLAGGMLTNATKLAKASAAKLLEKYLEEPSLQAAHKTLKEKLKDSGIRIFVTIDDIDRLTQKEMVTIMQMVKTVGQLPNVVYLLAYDRAKLHAALDTLDVGDGAGYAEKILQHEIELPVPSRTVLVRIVEDDLKRIIGKRAGDWRYRTLMSRGVTRWVRKPRDVHRLSNAIRFSWTILQDELDPDDLLAMEGLRLFQPDVFEWIRGNHDFIFREGSFRLATDSARKQHVDMFISTLPRGTSADTTSILSILFGSDFSHARSHEDPAFRLHDASRRRISTKHNFDAYFALQPSRPFVAETAIDDLLRPDQDVDTVAGLLSDLIFSDNPHRSAIMIDLFEQLTLRLAKKEIQSVIAAPLLEAIFAIGERFLRKFSAPDAVSVSPRTRLLELVAQLLETLRKDQPYAKYVVHSIFEKRISAIFAADVYAECCLPPEGSISETGTNDMIPDDIAEYVQRRLKELLEHARDEKRLERAPYFRNILTAWRAIERNDSRSNAPNTWLIGAIRECLKAMVTIAREFVVVGDHDGKIVHTFASHSYPKVYENLLTDISDAATHHMEKDTCPQRVRDLLSTLVDGLEALPNVQAMRAIDRRFANLRPDSDNVPEVPEAR